MRDEVTSRIRLPRGARWRIARGPSREARPEEPGAQEGEFVATLPRGQESEEPGAQEGE